MASGAATHTSGGYSIGASGGRAACHARTSSNVAIPRAYPAGGRPGFGTAIVSFVKYQRADAIALGSAWAPSVTRKSPARYTPRKSLPRRKESATSSDSSRRIGAYVIVRGSDGHRQAGGR